MAEIKKYDTKLAACLFMLLTLFISILLASSISNHMVPVDVHADNYFQQDGQNRALGDKVFLFSWGVQWVAILVWWFKKEKQFKNDHQN